MAKAAKKRSAKTGSARQAGKAGTRKTQPKKRTAGRTAKKAAKRPTGRKTARRSAPARGGRPSARSAAEAKRPPRRARTSPPVTTAARKKNAARAAAGRRSSQTSERPATSTLGSAATMIRGAVAGAVAAVAQKLPWTSDKLDAIQMLERDHRRFEELLEQGEATTARAVRARTELLATLTRELNEHELKEEQFLYPLLQSHPEAREIVLEGYQEHHVADVIVKELHDVAADDEQWAAKFSVLRENLEHHIREEEGEMFRVARASIPREELVALGERMQEAAGA